MSDFDGWSCGQESSEEHNDFDRPGPPNLYGTAQAVNHRVDTIGLTDRGSAVFSLRHAKHESGDTYSVQNRFTD